METAQIISSCALHSAQSSVADDLIYSLSQNGGARQAATGHSTWTESKFQCLAAAVQLCARPGQRSYRYLFAYLHSAALAHCRVMKLFA